MKVVLYRAWTELNPSIPPSTSFYCNECSILPGSYLHQALRIRNKAYNPRQPDLYSYYCCCYMHEPPPEGWIPSHQRKEPHGVTFTSLPSPISQNNPASPQTIQLPSPEIYPETESKKLEGIKYSGVLTAPSRSLKWNENVEFLYVGGVLRGFYEA